MNGIIRMRDVKVIDVMTTPCFHSKLRIINPRIQHILKMQKVYSKEIFFSWKFKLNISIKINKINYASKEYKIFIFLYIN